MSRNFFKLTVDLLISLALSILVFQLLELYTEGDRLHYSNYYDAVRDVTAAEAIELGAIYLSAREPVSLLFLSVGSWLEVPYNIYLSLLNFLLVYLLLFLLSKHHVKQLDKFFLLTNSYFFVLLLSAERLKIGYIFLFGLFLAGRWLRGVAAIASFLSHFQMAITLGSIIVLYLKDFLHSRTASKLLFLCFVFLFLIVFFSNLDGVISKIVSNYKGFFDIVGFMKILVISLVGLISVKRVSIAISLFPVGLLALLLGGDRLVMVAYTVLVVFTVASHKTHSKLFRTCNLYFSFKTIFLIYNVVVYNNAFP